MIENTYGEVANFPSNFLFFIFLKLLGFSVSAPTTVVASQASTPAIQASSAGFVYLKL